VAREDPRTDAELLAVTAIDPEAFGAFYRRHLRAVLAYLLHRTRRPEIAADLTAETFAAALEGAPRF
jgi:DNA-directed RNA polymerase specialized sigma24 family protein